MSVPSCATISIDPKRAEEMKRRTDLLIRSGQVPEWLFLCGNDTGVITFPPQPGGNAVLLFTTPFAAQDYLRVTKVSGQVRQIKFDDLPATSINWKKAGANSFVLNRCPRCLVANVISIDVMGQKEKLRHVWAVYRTLQLFMGEPKVYEYLRLSSTSGPQARAVLELIRDHVDCGVPYVHELIAYLAHREGDEPAMDAAIERLKEFGPHFANWKSRWLTTPDGKSSWLESFTTATAGLAAAFGIQLAPKAK